MSDISVILGLSDKFVRNPQGFENPAGFGGNVF